MSLLGDYPDFSPHVAQAAQIAGTGVPLLTKSGIIANQAADLPAGTSQQVGTFSVTQTGYEVFADAYSNSSATVPFMKIGLLWQDSGTGLPVATDTFIMPVTGSSAVPFEVFGSGPTKADQVIITLTNLDPAQDIHYTVYLLQNSRVYARDSWHWAVSQMLSPVVPGWTLPMLVADETVLGVLDSVSVAAGATATRLCGMAPGQNIQVSGNTAGVTPASITLTAFAVPNSVYGSGSVLLRATLAASSFAYTITGPRAPIELQVANTATSGTLTVSCMLITQA